MIGSISGIKTSPPYLYCPCQQGAFVIAENWLPGRCMHSAHAGVRIPTHAGGSWAKAIELVARTLHAHPEIPTTWWLGRKQLNTLGADVLRAHWKNKGGGLVSCTGLECFDGSAKSLGQQSLVDSFVIQTIQMERLNNGSKQMTCSCIRLMNWLPCSGPASYSYSALEKLKMKLKFFANLTSFPPSPMHPATTRCTRLCCAASALPHQSVVFSGDTTNHR